MPTVWAVMRKAMLPSTGIWEKGSWDHFIEFTSLGELVGKLKGLKLSEITKFGIVAHGNKPGLVILERDLTAESAPSFESGFSAISKLMSPNGRLIFFSCKAGEGKPGTDLLNILSGRFFPKQYVIGFEVFGYIAPGGDPNKAGMVIADLVPTDASRPDLIVADQTGDKTLTEHSWFSKWSFNGKIIRLPEGDQAVPTKFSRTTYGVRSAEEAIRSHRREIDYVAIDNHKAGSARLRGVVDAFGSLGSYPNKLRFLPRHDLDHLARTRAHEGVVVIWTQDMLLYKCANPTCPGHSKSWHFCTEYLKQFQNGPLDWP